MRAVLSVAHPVTLAGALAVSTVLLTALAVAFLLPASPSGLVLAWGAVGACAGLALSGST